MSTDFKSRHTFEERVRESTRVRDRYPDRIPCVCEPLSTSDLSVDKTKYLVPGDLNIGQLGFILRRRMNLEPEKALFVFMSKSRALVHTSKLVRECYSDYGDEDGFLYMVFSSENTFGCPLTLLP